MRIRDRQQLFEAFCRIAIDRAGFQAVRLVFRERPDAPLSIAVQSATEYDGFGELVEPRLPRCGEPRRTWRAGDQRKRAQPSEIRCP